jgi:hypothetical protein
VNKITDKKINEFSFSTLLIRATSIVMYIVINLQNPIHISVTKDHQSARLITRLHMQCATV